MACVAPDPKVSVQAAWKGAPSGRARDWQPGTGLPSSVNETVPVGGAELGDVAGDGGRVRDGLTRLRAGRRKA